MSRLQKLTGETSGRYASVVLVHGLGGHISETWGQSAITDLLWPLWLANDVPGLAVFSMGYDATVSRWSGRAMHLTDQATNLFERLLVEPELQDGPLVMIGHSLGGLLIKQLLRTAESEARNRADAANLLRRVKKVAFLATPHTGSSLAVLADRLRILIRPSAATASLVRNDPNLRDLNLWYRDWASSSGIIHLILVETKPIKLFGMVVRPDSSDPGITGSRPIPVDADHIEICKPKDRSSDAYIHIRSFVERPLMSINAKSDSSAGTSDIFRSISVTPKERSSDIHTRSFVERPLVPINAESKTDLGASDILRSSISSDRVSNTTYNITINLGSNAEDASKLADVLRAIVSRGELKMSGSDKEWRHGTA